MGAAIYSFFLLLLCYRSVADVNLQFYPKFHLAPPKGWMNAPSGFCYFKEKYHLYYEYNPESSLNLSTPHWGHATSKDLVNWQHEPIAIYPDKPYDIDGVLSGSAFVENDTMYVFYTGNLDYPGRTPDHLQHQILAQSTDGYNFTKSEYNPILEGDDRQPNFRDPKVWKHGDTYYMVLGNSFDNDTRGRALLYSSNDMLYWQEASILEESQGSQGSMWEQPELFLLGGVYILMFTAQGIAPDGRRINNRYQTVYLTGLFNYDSKTFATLVEFRVVDGGHDFYAARTMIDKDGNRVMIARMDMPGENYPESEDGFTGCMTIPRILGIASNGRLTQIPVEDINRAVGKILYSNRTMRGTIIKLQNNTAKIEVNLLGPSNVQVSLDTFRRFSLTIEYEFFYSRVTFDRGGEDGKRSTTWLRRFPILGKFKMIIYVDRSSVEVFFGNGDATFTSRIFPDGPLHFRVHTPSVANVSVYAMEQTIPNPN